MSRDGPATINAEYIYVFPSDTIIFRVVGFRSFLWTFPPLRDMSETRLWKTDVIKTRLQEDRSVVREFPRIKWDYSFRFQTGAELARAESTALGSVGFSIGLPIWSNVFIIPTINISDTVILFDTTESELRISDNIIIWKSYDVFEVGTIQAINDTSITLLNPVAASYSNACLMLVSTGNVPAGINFTQGRGHRNTASLSCTVIDNYNLETWPNAETLDSLPVVDVPASIGSGLASRYQRTVVIQDSVLGVLTQYDDEYYTRTYKTVSFITNNYTQLYVLRRQLDYMQGKMKPFWISTFRDDFIPTEPLTEGSFEIRVVHNNWSRNPPKALRIVGNITFVSEINTIADNLDGTESIDLVTSLPIITNLKTISVMTKVRSDSDSIEVKHIGGIQRVRIPVVEVPD